MGDRLNCRCIQTLSLPDSAQTATTASAGRRLVSSARTSQLESVWSFLALRFDDAAIGGP
jgi:hypothetical protein